MTTCRHPDAAWLSQVRRALDWWADLAPRTPTSSITGGGAVAALEQAAARLAGRPTLALPAATYGLRIALRIVGVCQGDEVLVNALDWPAAGAAVRSWGAHPVPVALNPATLEMDPDAAAAARTEQTKALLVTHLHGVCADVPALRATVGADLPVVEDAAQAFGATLDGYPAGSLGDVGVLSFGPGKTIDAGELAVLITRDDDLRAAAIRCSQHPIRQRLAGIPTPDFDQLTGRATPLSALVAAYQLHHWPEHAKALRAADLAVQHHLTTAIPEIVLLTAGSRHRGTPGVTTVLLPASTAADSAHMMYEGKSRAWMVMTSGARPSWHLNRECRQRAAELADRIRMIVVDSDQTE